MNAFKLIGALGLSLASFAAAAQAAPNDSTASLRQSAGGSDMFSRSADGSTERAELEGPAFVPAASRAAAAPLLTPGRPPFAALTEVPPSAFAARAAAATQSPLRRDPVAAAGVLGTGLFLAIGAMFLRHSGPPAAEAIVAAPQTYATDSVISALATPGARTPAPRAAVFDEPRTPEPVCAPRFAAPAADAFVDTRMPVGTWRAISRAEQALIESWDASREKALGQASLEQWLERHPAPGVDVAALQTKLARA